MSTQAEKLKQIRAQRDPALKTSLQFEEFFSTIKGDKGDTGEKGDKGDRGERGPIGPKGDTGPRGEQGIPGRNGLHGADGRDGRDGKDGKDGKDGISPKIDALITEVVAELEKRPLNKNIVTKTELTDFLKRGGFRGGGDTVAAGTGISVTRAGGVATIAATGSFTIITITGTADDSNVTFTALSQPTLLNINGAFYQQTGGAITWSYSGGTITLSSAVGSGGSIFGI